MQNHRKKSEWQLILLEWRNVYKKITLQKKVEPNSSEGGKFWMSVLQLARGSWIKEKQTASQEEPFWRLSFLSVPSLSAGQKWFRCCEKCPNGPNWAFWVFSSFCNWKQHMIMHGHVSLFMFSSVSHQSMLAPFSWISHQNCSVKEKKLSLNLKGEVICGRANMTTWQHDSALS